MSVFIYPGRLRDGKVEFAGQVDLPEGCEVDYAVLAPDTAR